MKQVTVVGSGTMGNGIAHVFALYDHAVTLVDIDAGALERALATIRKNLTRQLGKGTIDAARMDTALANIKTSTSISAGCSTADLVIEAVSENIDVKINIFKQLDSESPPHAILASNTSSISITRIAAATGRPDKVIGMHFMNPVPLMRLVEVIRGYNTSRDVTNAILALSRKLEKIPVEVADYPGFVSNRILMPMINEAICALHEGVAGVAEIDEVMKLGMAHPMGPLELADFIGLDVCLFILRVLHEGLGNPKYAPCPLLVNMVTAGHKGIKSGIGFYQYTAGSKEKTVAVNFQ